MTNSSPLSIYITRSERDGMLPRTLSPSSPNVNKRIRRIVKPESADIHSGTVCTVILLIISISPSCWGPGIHYRKPRFCRVRQGLLSANLRTHDKHKFCRVCSRNHTAKPKHTVKSWFAVCFFVTHGKACLCRVFYFGTRQSNKNFLSSHLETFSILHIQHVVLHVKIWYIFVFIYYI